jgi:hypothetical protein
MQLYMLSLEKQEKLNTAGSDTTECAAGNCTIIPPDVAHLLFYFLMDSAVIFITKTVVLQWYVVGPSAPYLRINPR